MKRTVYINGRSLILGTEKLIQSGGEGMVFAMGADALKIYHSPQPAHGTKLRAWMNNKLSLQLPDNILGPWALIADKNGQIIGYQMPRLSAGSKPIKLLSNPLSWQKHNLEIDQVIPLLAEIQATLQKLHDQKIVVGDLNDQNIFYELNGNFERRSSSLSSWIDVDSYQFGGYPCPVAMPAFLDPQLYGVGDLGRNPYFSTGSDWYAFLVLLVKSLLQVHPYGGVHHQLKSIQARAAAGMSFLNPAVTYPKLARPPEALPDDLLHQIHLMFDKGGRAPLPSHLLTDLASTLVICPTCRQFYPNTRRKCPTCLRANPVRQGNGAPAHHRQRAIFQVDGYIEAVSVQPDGRIAAVVRTGTGYQLFRLGVGGVLNQMHLFEGRVGYRFGYFTIPGESSYLAVNPPHGPQLLLLDVGGTTPRKVSMLGTAQFRDTAVFATTPHSLFRIAGNWIMRGKFRGGHYLEDPIGTAHKAQTQLFASPYHDLIAGFHRLFSETHFFAVDSDGANYTLDIPSPRPGEHLADASVHFGPKSIAISMMMKNRSKSRLVWQIYRLNGTRQMTLSEDLGAANLEDSSRAWYPFTLNAAMTAPPFKQLPHNLDIAATDLVHPHPAGLLLQCPNRLCLVDQI